jgi:Tfp pilus assembly protein PilO
MNTVREYRMPLLIGAGALVVALLLWAILISPQTSKLSTLQTEETQLQEQQTALQVKLTALKTEKQNLTKSCADLEKISTQIPSVQSPTDVDAEESSFESQFNGLAASSGVTLSQFSGFAPASGTTAAPTTSGTAQTPAGVVAVPTTLTVTGNYGQMTSFVKGLDSFPRLFVIQTFDLATGAPSSSTTGSSSAGGSSSSGGSAALSPTATPLWVGGSSNSASGGPYSLAIDGSIYYTTAPNALTACTKATAILH